jgi:hypothetical protein
MGISKRKYTDVSILIPIENIRPVILDPTRILQELNLMNMNWKIIKVVGAFVVIAGIIFWAFTATRSQSYSGTNLDFEVAGGAVVVTNPSDQSIPVQFMGTGTRSFRVSSDIEGISGNSTREGSGSTTTQLFELELPPGISEFFVTRGTNVTFVAPATSELEATVHPMTADSSRNAIIAAIVVVLGLLFYASNAVEHSWIRMLKGESTLSQDTEPTPVVSSAQGRAARSFGDNRAETGD